MLFLLLIDDSLDRAIYRMFQADCKVKDLDLAIVMGDSLRALGPKPLIKADPGRLQQIIVNLCSNAIKFTAKQPERKVNVRLEVDLRPPESGAPIIPSGAALPLRLADGQEIWLYVSVTDTGPGLKPDEISKLFSKFTQANPEIHTQMGGNGLGLFIAKQLCTLQDGRIEAVSPGKGSTFRFYIRAETVSKPAELSRSISAPQVQTIVSDLRALNILVVDDNAINRKMLSRQLRMFKHSVQVAEDGLEALVSRFDCIDWSTILD
jgi:signal transduction histidine kinase